MAGPSRDLVVRPVAERDRDAVAALLTRTNANVSEAELRLDHAKWRERFPSIQLGAYDGEKLLGFIGGRIDSADPTLGWSDDTVVADDAQGRGVGSALLRAQLDAFRALHCTRVRGLSPERHFQAIAFFERHGFRVVEKTVAHGWWGIAEGEALCITECQL